MANLCGGVLAAHVRGSTKPPPSMTRRSTCSADPSLVSYRVRAPMLTVPTTGGRSNGRKQQRDATPCQASVLGNFLSAKSSTWWWTSPRKGVYARDDVKGP